MEQCLRQQLSQARWPAKKSSFASVLQDASGEGGVGGNWVWSTAAKAGGDDGFVLAFHDVHRERRDDAVRQLVEDVERLEGRDRRHAAGLGLDDEDLLLSVHDFSHGRRAAGRAMVRPVRVRAHADAAVLRGDVA